MTGPTATARQAGFTLLEVLIALAVLAIALAALIKVGGDNAAATAYLRERTLAHWVGMNQVAEIQVKGEWPSVGTKRGEEEMANHEWYWEVKVSETPDQDIRRLDVEVRLNEDQEAPPSTLTAYLAKPIVAAPQQ